MAYSIFFDETVQKNVSKWKMQNPFNHLGCAVSIKLLLKAILIILNLFSIND